VAQLRGEVDGVREAAQAIDQAQRLRLRSRPDVAAADLVDAGPREAAVAAPLDDRRENSS